MHQKPLPMTAGLRCAGVLAMLGHRSLLLPCPTKPASHQQHRAPLWCPGAALVPHLPLLSHPRLACGPHPHCAICVGERQRQPLRVAPREAHLRDRGRRRGGRERAGAGSGSGASCTTPWLPPPPPRPYPVSHNLPQHPPFQTGCSARARQRLQHPTQIPRRATPGILHRCGR